MKLYDLTKQLLEEYEPLRNDDKKLLWATWSKLGLTDNGTISKDKFYNAPSSESVTRARRKVQENYPNLQANEIVKGYRKEIERQKGTHIYREKITTHYRFIRNSVEKCDCELGESH